MEIDKNQKRLNAIKLKYVIFPTKCNCCGKEYVREKMWRVFRWGENMTSVKWNYCQRCMHSAEEVLNEIDTDEGLWEISHVDDFTTCKKDYTRLNRCKPPRKDKC